MTETAPREAWKSPTCHRCESGPAPGYTDSIELWRSEKAAECLHCTRPPLRYVLKEESDERTDLASQAAAIRSMLETMPDDDPVGRLGFESRLRELEAGLAALEGK